MPLTVAERKHLMPHGAQKEVATEEGVDESYVSRVMDDDVRPKTATGKQTLRRVQVALARRLRVKVHEAFPPQSEEVSPAGV